MIISFCFLSFPFSFFLLLLFLFAFDLVVFVSPVYWTYITVKPVLSSPVLNSDPLLSGQLQKSRKFLLLTTLNVTSIKRSPLLSGRGHLLQSPSEGISIVFNCIKRSLH